jgi:hypothetical protein
VPTERPSRLADALSAAGFPMVRWHASTEPQALSADTLRAAIERVRSHTGYEPTPLPVLSPAAHEMACQLAGLPPGSTLTRADFSRAQQALYDRCTPEERERLVAIAWGGC